jgi:ParB/RepB/Spo0J family partition protein
MTTRIPFNTIEANYEFNIRSEESYAGSKKRNEQTIPELAASIKARAGLITPLLVAKIGENGDTKYRLIAGFRRHMALKSLKWGAKEIEVTIREFLNDKEIDLANIIENVRNDVHPHDLSARLRFLEAGDEATGRAPLDRKELAQATGLSVSHIGNLVRLNTKLAPMILENWVKNDLPLTWLLSIAKLDHEGQLTEYKKWLSGEIKAKEKAKAKDGEETSGKGGKGEGGGEGGGGEDEDEDDGKNNAPSKSEVRDQLAKLQAKLEKLDGDAALIAQGKIHAMRWMTGEITRL